MGDLELLTHIGAVEHKIDASQSFLTIFVTCSDSVRDVDNLLQLLINAAEDIAPEEAGGERPTKLIDRTTRRKVTIKLVEAESTRRSQSAKDRESFQVLSLPERYSAWFVS